MKQLLLSLDNSLNSQNTGAPHLMMQKECKRHGIAQTALKSKIKMKSKESGRKVVMDKSLSYK